jgi:hypothetical protein
MGKGKYCGHDSNPKQADRSRRLRSTHHGTRLGRTTQAAKYTEICIDGKRYGNIWSKSSEQSRLLLPPPHEKTQWSHLIERGRATNQWNKQRKGPSYYRIVLHGGIREPSLIARGNSKKKKLGLREIVAGNLQSRWALFAGERRRRGPADAKGAAAGPPIARPLARSRRARPCSFLYGPAQ